MAEAATKRRAADNKAPRKPKWHLLQPKLNLHIRRLKNHDLFTVQNFFLTAESKALIKAAKSTGFEHQGSLGPAKGEAYRNNDRISVNDPALADMVWQSGLSKLFSDIKIRGRVAVGLNPNIMFYRYKIGQHFGRHIGESVDLGKEKRTVAPAEGMVLLHIHGDKCMLHEARNVSNGIKYVFRSDVVFA
ncbi:putative Peroxidase [Hibiscus syriacus]|uniref:Peroxidase n=1 Tax=Hibiscus syriacus TaxID=106335 RepID=A0A6A3A1L0_HIBSY|nr:putative Peroxidase [Hibiscus syriacus]